MKTKTAALLVLSAGLTVGCAKDQNQAHLDAASAARNAPIAPEAALSANTRFAAGQVAESQNDPVRAEAQYEAAVKADPKATNALLRLGIVYTNNQQYNRAVDAWNRYIKATNGAAAGYSNLGYTLVLANRLPDAEAAFQAGIAREPKNESCRLNYGLMLARQGRLNEAEAQMSAVLTPAQVHYNIASVLEARGNKDAAKAEFQKAITADPDMNDAKQRLATLDKN